jgi:type I restriction enzyme S subunit
MNQKDNILPDGYRLTELGPLPEEWRVVRLGEVLEEVVERVNDSKLPHAADLPVLSLTKNEGLVLQSDRFGKRIATEDVSEYKVVRKGQIVYNPYVIWEGAIHILAKYEAGIVSPVYPVLQAKFHEADPYFLDAWLRTPPAIAAYNRFAAGAVNRRRAIRKPDFLQISIPLPPLSEQRAIAHVLRTVQQAREATERVIAATRELKKSLMRHLFTYGPVPVDQADQVPMRETDIGPIPAHWRVVRLGDVVILRNEIVSPSDNPRARYVGLEHLDSGEICIKRYGYALETRSAKFTFNPGDILYGKLRPYLDKSALAVWPGVCSTDILVLIPKYTAPIFAAYLMHSPFVLNHAIATTTGVNHPRTSWKALSQAPIPLPPLSDQREIARILQAVERKIEAEEARKQALEALFKTLLRQLMSGKLRVVGLSSENPEESS